MVSYEFALAMLYVDELILYEIINGTRVLRQHISQIALKYAYGNYVI